MTMVHELEHLHHLDERAKTDHMIIFISCEYLTLWTRIHVVDFVAYKHDGFQAFGYDETIHNSKPTSCQCNMEMVIQTACLSAGCWAQSRYADLVMHCIAF